MKNIFKKYFGEFIGKVGWSLDLKFGLTLLRILKVLRKIKEYQKAVSGENEIQCFNDWVNELKENNYLHNHTRMWFASIWIFTLNLPWQKGAEFFMKHLLMVMLLLIH